MKKILLSCAVLLFPAVAHAQNNDAVCRLVGQHKPVADVAYKGGVDVHGKAVVPADVNGVAATDVVPEVIKVPVNADLAKRVSGLTGQNLQMDAPLGMLEIHQDGKVSYNGQDWTAPVMTLCGFSHAVINDPAADTIAKTANVEPAAPGNPAAPVAPAEPLKPTTNIDPKTASAGQLNAAANARAKMGNAYKGQMQVEVAPSTTAVEAPEAPKVQASQAVAVPPPNMPSVPEVVVPAKNPDEPATRIISNRPDLIEGGAYRESGE